jgi:dTDP-4-amino-4,6-dideoxygalactose transaminase
MTNTAQGPHKVTFEFEQAICNYTGAPYCVSVDNASNALWLCLMRVGVQGQELTIPSHTYVSVPCEIKLAGAKVKFEPSEPVLKGAYQIKPTKVWDAALQFTADMYKPNTMMCVSFTGPYKHLKLGKGGAILLDNEADYLWLKRARNSGRGEMSYHVDKFDIIGRNCYMMPDVAARGLLLIGQFYNLDGTKIHTEDMALPYPDLSKFEVYTK